MASYDSNEFVLGIVVACLISVVCSVAITTLIFKYCKSNYISLFTNLIYILVHSFIVVVARDQGY